jgi:Sulfotransferase family
MEPLQPDNELVLCDSPIFIVGSPRSGTSILGWALAQHSRLTTSVESDILCDLFGNRHAEHAFNTARARPDGKDWLNYHAISEAEFLGYLGLGLNALITSRSGNKRWIDQTPRNTLMIDTLAQLFPTALFIHIIRDGRRVVHSMTNFSRLLGADANKFVQSGRLPNWATDFAAACRTWQVFIDAAYTASGRYPDRFLTVANERLVTETERNFATIFRFLREPPEPATAEYFRSNRINSSFGNETPILARPWEHWSSEQNAIFEREAGTAMSRYEAELSDMARA